MTTIVSFPPLVRPLSIRLLGSDCGGLGWPALPNPLHFYAYYFPANINGGGRDGRNGRKKERNKAKKREKRQEEMWIRREKAKWKCKEVREEVKKEE